MMLPSRSTFTIISAVRLPLNKPLGVIQISLGLLSVRALILPPVEVIQPWWNISLLISRMVSRMSPTLWMRTGTAIPPAAGAAVDEGATLAAEGAALAGAAAAAR